MTWIAERSLTVNKVTVIPYLSFNSCCEEAMNTYIQAFGGEVYYLSRWTEETCGGNPEKIGKGDARGICAGQYTDVGRGFF